MRPNSQVRISTDFSDIRLFVWIEQVVMKISDGRIYPFKMESSGIAVDFVMYPVELSSFARVLF